MFERFDGLIKVVYVKRITRHEDFDLTYRRIFNKCLKQG